jgi:hypothetical protein
LHATPINLTSNAGDIQGLGDLFTVLYKSEFNLMRKGADGRLRSLRQWQMKNDKWKMGNGGCDYTGLFLPVSPVS